ncbi:MAG: PTS IIA-like nitrogen regulatory protein PtsN [Hyphomicrobiaceae bacterium]
MDLGDLITPEGVIPQLKAKSKKQVLHDLAAIAAEQKGLDQRAVFETLLQRERLGSTGISKGIAIPHGRLATLKQIVCLFARIDEPVDFDALDGEKVDLVFLLLAPESAGADHLKALARISRLVREPAAIEKLRASSSRAALYSILTEPLASNAA